MIEPLGTVQLSKVGLGLHPVPASALNVSAAVGQLQLWFPVAVLG
jgi:hypothetical protein